MTQQQARPQKSGIIWFVLGGIAGILFLFGIVRLPGVLAAADDGAYIAGAVLGALFWGVVAAFLILRGVRVRRRS